MWVGVQPVWAAAQVMSEHRRVRSNADIQSFTKSLIFGIAGAINVISPERPASWTSPGALALVTYRLKYWATTPHEIVPGKTLYNAYRYKYHTCYEVAFSELYVNISLLKLRTPSSTSITTPKSIGLSRGNALGGEGTLKGPIKPQPSRNGNKLPEPARV
eukprot:751221-Hanusia_phi.AAC.2